jgi:ferrous iron transport protein B
MEAKTSPVIALVGNPNSGKSTIFNVLTGLRQKIGNYAGVTVERKEGIFFSQHGKAIRLLDLPGSYSLEANSPDEAILMDVLLGRSAEVDAVDGIVCIIDATEIERQLYLTLQILPLGKPVLIVLTMMDEAQKQGIQIDTNGLSGALGVPVIACQGTAPKTLIALKVALSSLAQQGVAPKPVFASRRIEDVLVSQSAHIRKLHERARSLASQFVHHRNSLEQTFSERIDSILLHPLWGFICLTAVLLLLFYSIFVVAETPKGWIEDAVSWLGQTLSNWLPEGLLRGLIVDGGVAGVGAVLAFVPQIACLLLFIGILESTGYMARAAFILDRFMQKVGLQGKSFIPMLSSYACAIPGIMATRIIDSPKDRLATILIAPWASCSARLPVYAVMIATLAPASGFGNITKAFILLGAYALGTFSAFGMALIFKKTLLKGPDSALGIIELPPYRLPSIKALGLDVYLRTKSFVTNAGTVILALSMVLWFMLSHPMQPEAPASQQLAQSYGGQLGQFIEPILKPLGFDWKIGVGLIASFAAREVFVSTMAIVYHAENADLENTAPLEAALRSQTNPDGSVIFTPLVCLSLIVFYIYAHQCLSTLAAVKRETGGWRWPIFQFVYMTIIAYLASLIVYQGGILCGLG